MLLNCRSYDAQKSRSGHTSCDGTAGYLLLDCGSVGQRHRAMTGATEPEERGVVCLP